MAYTPINATVAGNAAATRQEADKVRDAWAASGGAAMTTEEKVQKYGDIINQTLGGTSHNSATGYYTNDAANAQKAQSQYGATVTPTTYNGQGGYYNVDGQDRTAAAGNSGADEDLMTDGDYAIIQQLKAEYEAAKARGDTAAMNAAHQEAERVRAGYGYLGGTDGSMYVTLGKAGNNNTSSGYNTGVSTSSGYNTGVSSQSTPSVTLNANDYLSGDINTDLSSQFSRYDPSELKSLLEEWKAAAVEQSNGQVDYAVQQAVTELERALADAQPQFKEQTEAVAKDEMQGLDNSALYAEARGDKGGVGQGQYNEVQAAAAQNRLAVQQAQTKLTTDTQRQIADLRAQGEFEKADAALEISQQYLSQLMSLEQWAAEYNLSYDQFQASLEQWAVEYELAMAQFKAGLDQWNAEYGLAVDQFNTSKDQWNAEFGLAVDQFNTSKDQWAAEFGLAAQQFQTGLDQWNAEYDLSVGQLTGQLSDGTLTLSGKSQLASMGEALLSAGIMPTAEQLSAMGMTESQATAWLTAQRLEAASKSGSSGSGNSGKVSSGKASGAGDAEDEEVVEYATTGDATDALFFEAYASGNAEAYLNNTNAYKDYGLTSKTGLVQQYSDWLTALNKTGNDLYNTDIDGLAAQWQDIMLQYNWSPASLVSAMRARGYNDAVIDAVLARLGL